jgi:hypothetical protein
MRREDAARLRTTRITTTLPTFFVHEVGNDTDVLLMMVMAMPQTQSQRILQAK